MNRAVVRRIEYEEGWLVKLPNRGTDRRRYDDMTFPKRIQGLENISADASAVASRLRQDMEKYGAVWIRIGSNFTRERFKNLLSSLGVAFESTYPVGLSPRKAMGDFLFSSTETKCAFPISAHTEMAYARYRPGFISFFCEVEPVIYGETPLVNNRAFYRDIPHRLRIKLEAKGLLYRRYFLSKPGRFNFKKSWQEAFGTAHREQVEAQAHQLSMHVQWQENGDLVTEIRLPAIVAHPGTGEKAVSMNLFHPESYLVDLEQIRDRYNPLTCSSWDSI